MNNGMLRSVSKMSYQITISNAMHFGPVCNGGARFKVNVAVSQAIVRTNYTP